MAGIPEPSKQHISMSARVATESGAYMAIVDMPTT